MNYNIEHRINGNNRFGHDEIVSIGDHIVVKVYESSVDEYGDNPNYIFNDYEIKADGEIQGILRQTGEPIVGMEALAVEFRDKTWMTIYFMDIEWFEKL